MAFEVGARVRILTLQSRPELNNTIAVVRKPANDVEAKALKANNRILVTGIPNPLSIKESNLELIDESKQCTDWTCIEIRPSRKKSGNILLNIYDFLQREELGGISRCDEFVAKLCEEISQNLPLPRLTFDRKALFDKILNMTSKHCIYFCYFDQIGHHLVFETKEGKCRLFQSFIKADATFDALSAKHHETVPFVGISSSLGFTAQEWASKDTPLAWAPKLRAAHARWGKSQELNLSALENLISLLWLLQDQAEAIAIAMTAGLPDDLARAEKAYWAAAEASPAAAARTTSPSPVTLWTRDVLKDPSAFSVTDDGAAGGLAVLSNARFCGAPFRIAIPGRLAGPFADAFSQLTGHEPAAYVFLQALHYARWRVMRAPDPRTGKTMAIGWGVSAMVIEP